MTNQADISRHCDVVAPQTIDSMHRVLERTTLTESGQALAPPQQLARTATSASKPSPT